ncbi:hypothetical protein L5515_008657 [Caenorhabditis briggsae]|uniref:Uncharacterized protein n=1 Tax=Caenorhabditis briggsae TaxID=6238 RepID=A0AAE9F7S3_CAEBR|nr:hypothetical protein L5515_008657 [Caenorhabditis briggsae]
MFGIGYGGGFGQFPTAGIIMPRSFVKSHGLWEERQQSGLESYGSGLEGDDDYSDSVGSGWHNDKDGDWTTTTGS